MVNELLHPLTSVDALASRLRAKPPQGRERAVHEVAQPSLIWISMQGAGIAGAYRRLS